MGKADDYRRFARACLEEARATEDPQTRALMLQMAQVWHRLAHEHARDEKEEPED
jgi:hypothetical protein